MAYGGLGAPGVRIKRDLTEQSELWTNVKIAAVVVVLCDIVLTVILLTAIKSGWWALPILGLVIGFFIGFSGLMLTERLRIYLPRWALFILGNLWAILCFAGFGVGYLGRTKVDPMILLLGEQIWSAFDLDWWWYAIGGAVLLVSVALVRKWQFAVAVLGAEIVTGLVLAADPAKYAQIWSVASWILLIYTWPGAAVIMVLIMKLLHEIVFPSLEFVLEPFSLEEYREVGLWGLLLPRLFGQREPEAKPEPAEVIDVNMVVQPDDRIRPQTQRPRLPGGKEAKAFYQAVHRGESFSERTALKYHVGLETFRTKIRDGFVDRGLADWKDKEHHSQGVNVFDSGDRLIEHLALIGTTP